MGQAVLNNVVIGVCALLCGIVLGVGVHRAMIPSDVQSASSRLEEKVQLVVGNDNRAFSAEQQRESLALVVGQRVLEAVALYPGADSVSRERIQRNVERVLHAGILEDIPYADTRAASIGLARCIQAHPHDDEALRICLRQTQQTVQTDILPPPLRSAV